jgi:hypothetical protein
MFSAVNKEALKNVSEDLCGNDPFTLHHNKSISISQPLVSPPAPYISSCLFNTTFIQSMWTKPVTIFHLYYTVKFTFYVFGLLKLLQWHIPNL